MKNNRFVTRTLASAFCIGVMGAATICSTTSRAADVSTQTDAEQIIPDGVKESEESTYGVIVDAESMVAINSTSFPDSIFRTYISETWDKDGDGELSEQERNNATYITVNNTEITSLQGIEFFPNLTKLEFGCTDVTSVDLSENTNLKKIICSATNISELDLSSNTCITYLMCNDTDITELDLTNNTKLQSLYCFTNDQLKSINVNTCADLTVLNCDSTGITSLNVSNNSKLELLSCYGTAITSLNVTKNTELETLSCSYTEITSLNLSKNTDLRNLSCVYCKIDSLDLTNNTALENLTCNQETKVTGCPDSAEVIETDVKEWINDGGTMRYYEYNVLIKNKWVLGDDGKKRYVDSNGAMVKNQFKSDGTYTYFLQNDGSPMTNRLTYHPDGVHVIYFDEYGHEVFDNFANVKKSISGDTVNDLCYFNTYGYMYVDKLTYNKAGTVQYYANPYGVMECNGWFRFSDGGIGYANSDGTLMESTFTYDVQGRMVYVQANCHLALGLISDGEWYYLMDENDGHLIGQFK